MMLEKALPVCFHRWRTMKRNRPREISIEELQRFRSPLEGMEILPESPAPPPKEYIYVTKSDFGYKIGRTTRPELRPLQVAGNMPIKLEVIAVIEVEDSTEWERRLHWHFEDKRLRGEWFSLDPSDVELIKGIPQSFDNLHEPDIPF